MLKRSAVLMLCALLASCGGGGGAPSPIPSSAPPGPVQGQAQIHITIPAGTSGGTTAKRRAFVGSDAQGLTVGITPQGGSQTVASYALSGTACTPVSGGRACTIVVQAPFGIDTFAVELFDAAPVGGVIPSSAYLLGVATDANVSIQPGAVVPVIALYVAAQIGSIGLASSSAMLTFPANGVVHTGSVLIAPTDFGNQPISTGSPTPYNNPITATLTETGGSGHTQLTLNGTLSGSSATLSQSTQTLGVSYDGGGASGYYATVTLTAGGATSESFTVAPMYVTTTSPYYHAGTVTFTAPSQSASFSVSEALGSNTYGASLSAGCAAAVAGTGSGSSGTVILASTGAAAAPCAMNVTDGLGASYAIPYTTTTSLVGGVTIGGVTEYALTNSPSGPEPIVAGADGNLWVGETAQNAVDKITTSGVDTPYNVGTGPASSMVAANDGNIYFVGSSNAIYRVTPSGVVTLHTVGGTVNTLLVGITQGPDGNLWVVDKGDGQLWQVSLQLVLLNTYALDTNINGAIAVGSDGRVYVPSPTSALIYAVAPGGNPQLYGILGACTGASQIASDATDGNLYVTCSTSNSILQFQTSGVQTNYPIGQADAPRGLLAGPDGSVWFAAPGTNTIGRLNISSGAFTHYAVPTSGAYPLDLALGSDGRIWFTEFSASKIGVLTP